MRSAGIFLSILAAIMEFCGLSQTPFMEEPTYETLTFVCLDSTRDTDLDVMLVGDLNTLYNTSVFSDTNGTCLNYSFDVATITAEAEDEATEICQRLGLTLGGKYADEGYTLAPDNWWYCR